MSQPGPVPSPDDVPADAYAPTHYAPGWQEAAEASVRGRRRRVVVIAGVVGAVALAAAAALVTRAVTDARTRPLPTDVAAPTRAYAVQLVTGSCLRALPADGEVDQVDVVPCADPHAAQVVGQYAFDAAAVWPGQDAAHALVARSCVLREDEEAAGVRVVTWAPTERGWRRGDRTGLCVAVPGAPVVGSFLDGSATPAG